MKKIAFFVLLYFMAQIAVAEDAVEDKAEDKGSYSTSSSFTLQISTLPEVKLNFSQHFIFPFLRGESPLTANNNIDIALGAQVAPISLNGLAEAVWTPIAFFQLSAGGKIGAGWNINLFGKDIRGSAITRSGAGGMTEISGSAFDSLLWKVQAGGTFQMDLAAVIPGDWHHVVLKSYHEINYRGSSRAKAHESWFFENDDGENCNGFNYYGNLVIGYQMPIILDLVALLGEADLYLYDTPGRSQWGDEKARWTFSNVLNFSFTKQLSLSLITQLRTRRNYLEPNYKDLYYRNRHINPDKPLRLEFYRVVAALSYKL